MKFSVIIIFLLSCSIANASDKPTVYMTGYSHDSVADTKIQSYFSQYFKFTHVPKDKYIRPVPINVSYPEPIFIVSEKNHSELQMGHTKGKVLIYYIISSNGNVEKARAENIYGSPGLVTYLLDNVYKWKFKAAIVNGVSVSSAAVQEFEY